MSEERSTGYEKMFLAAVQSLAEISKALGIPDDDAACANGNELIMERIADLQRGIPQPRTR